MRLQAQQDLVARLEASMIVASKSADGWTTTFRDPVTNEHWRRVHLGAEYHGGGMPILVREPMPDTTELIEIAATSTEPAEIAAGAWLLSEMDREGGYKEPLLGAAEDAARRGDTSRAALLVGWGSLNDETNLRPTLGKHVDDISRDHDHFRSLAARARELLRLTGWHPPLRDRRVFGR